jgi:hypothetical protein
LFVKSFYCYYPRPSSTLKAEITKNVKVLLVESNTNFA